MNIINQKSNSDYSDFEYQWVILILYKELLPRKDMLRILKHFNMRFFGDDWENKISLEEIGHVIVSDVERDNLFPYLSDYLKKHYPKLFSYEEAKKIHDTLWQINEIVEIMKIWLSFNNSNDKPNLRSYIEEKLKFFEKLTSKERFINQEDKIIPGGYFHICLEEILISLYKLAMKSYLN